MSKKKMNYVVRGINVMNESFDRPTGVMVDKNYFAEKVVDKQFQALSVLFGDPNIMTMSVPYASEAGFNVCNQDVASFDHTQMVNVIDLNIVLYTGRKDDVRQLKSIIRETLLHWAEKSRVKNRRGFRSNAIRTPVYEYNASSTSVRTQIILSNAIYYAADVVDIASQDYNSISADLALLHKKLKSELGSYFDRIKYSHSLIGTGEM